MVFGSKDVFAIEAMTEPDLELPSAVWGRMRIWCQGRPIGNYSRSHCGLYPSYSGFQKLRLSIDGLWREEFNGLDDRSLWRLLDSLLYGYDGDIAVDDGRSVEECDVDARTYGRFDFLTNWGEQFDEDGKSFIFCPDGKTVRILNWRLLRDSHLSFNVPVERFCHAIDALSSWFEAEAARLRA
jgi:hypothetical protein